MSILILLSLLPMGLSQYGGCKGIQELPGWTALVGVHGLLILAAILLGLLHIFPTRTQNRVAVLLGLFGIVASEIYCFFTWHYMTITGQIAWELSLRFSFPEFWFGLAVSCLVIPVYALLEWKLPEDKPTKD